MSASDDLSPIARQALVDSCLESGVPVQLSDPVTIARLVALLRPTPSEDDRSRRHFDPASITVRCQSNRFSASPSGATRSKQR